MPARLLLITSATSYQTGRYLSAAKRLQFDVCLGCDQPLISAALVPGRSLHLDFGSPQSAVDRILEQASKQGFDALLGVDEPSCGIAALAARALHLDHNPPAAVAAAHDKYLFRQRLAQTGLPCPDFRLLRPADDNERIAEQIDYPCVLKPLRLNASRGVMRADNPEEFLAAAIRIDALLAGSAGQPREILIEQFIPGSEFALEGLLENGRLRMLALFDKPLPLDGPLFEESIYVTPSRASAPLQQSLLATTACTCAGLGLRQGPIHAELRSNAEGVWLIELATRSIGGRCSAALRFGNGAALEELILRNALGMPAAHLPREPGASAVMMIPIPAPGRLAAVHGLERARQVPGITSVRIDIAIGSELVPLPEGDRYLGFIFARGATANQAVRSVKHAHSLLHFAIEP